jgi:peroxiredoxin Q/BCP
MPVIDEGQPAPDFSLPDQTGRVHTLKAYAGRPVILYFYPKDDTSGCTKEACTFQASLPAFDTSQAAVFGVSVLGTESKAKFAKKYNLTFPLLADEDHAVADRYGAWQQKSLYGRKYMGVARITYLIGPDGRVAKRWDHVKPADHPAEVLAAVNALAART